MEKIALGEREEPNWEMSPGESFILNLIEFRFLEIFN